MAIVFYNGHDEQYALCDQGTWGTAATDGAAGQGIHMIGWDLKPVVNVVEWETAKAQRFYKTDDILVHERGAVHEITMPAIPFLKDQGDKFLYACMQNVSEGTATPYAKTFTFGQTQPDFSANAGCFYTLVNKMPVASTSHKVNDAIIRDLTLSCAPGANDGMLTVESTWLARGHSETSNYAGTITYPDATIGDDIYFFHDLTTTDITGATVVLGDEGFKLNITNNAAPIGHGSSMPGSFKLPFYKATITLQCLWDANLRTFMAAQRSGTTKTVTLTWGDSISADEYLSIVAIVKFNAPRDLSHASEGEFVTLTGECYGTYGSSYPLAIYMTNAVDRGW